MKQIVLCASIFFLLTTSLVSAQKELAEDMITFTRPLPESPFSIIDKNNALHLFFVYKQKLTYLQYNTDYKLVLNQTYDNPPSPFINLTGYSLEEDDKINLYFSNKKNNRFFVKTIQSGKTLIEKEFDFKIKKEVFIKAINHQNTFYILTAVKSENALKIYQFENNQYHIRSYDLSKERFYDSKNKIAPLADILKNADAPIIEDEVPSAIDITSKRIKIYPKKDMILITMDHRDTATRIIRLQLEDKAITSEVFAHSILTLSFGKSFNIKSNSFLYRNHLYQVAASKAKLILTIKNMTDGVLIKKYSFSKDTDEIPFKNSAIFQDGSTYSSGVRELDKTRQFLRKVVKGDIGVFAYEKDDLLQLQLGGISEVNTGRGATFPALGSPALSIPGAPTSLGLTYNPTFFAYDSYEKTRAVFMKCLFDINTLEHLPGPVEDNVFDKVSSYAEELNKIDIETIFRKGDYFIYGYYQKKEKKYRLLRFDP